MSPVPPSVNVMLLAAGRGERLRPFTDSVPKPLIPFMGVPMMEFALSHVERFASETGASIENLVVNTHHLPDQIVDYFENVRPKIQKKFWNEIHFSNEPTLLAGGGIKKAEKWLSTTERFFVVNADEVHFSDESSLAKMMEDQLKFSSLATLLCMEHEQVGNTLGGAWVDQDHSIQHFGKTSKGFSGLHFLGISLFSRNIFSYFKSPATDENLLYNVLTRAIAHGESVRAVTAEAEWHETGRVEDFIEATNYLIRRSPATLRSFLAKNRRCSREWKPVIEQQELKEQLSMFLRDFEK